MTNEAMREKLVAVANLLADLTGAVAEIAAEFGEVKVETAAPTEEKKKEVAAQTEEKKEAKKYTLEDVRKALAAKSGAGFTDEVRSLLERHGAAKLSAIAESEYGAIMEEVQTIGSTQ